MGRYRVVSISIITPTYPHGKCRLQALIASLRPQMDGRDEHLIYADGPYPEAERLVMGLEDPRIKFVTTPQTRRNGNAQREAAIRDAVCDVLFFLDDSMLPTSNALRVIRRNANPRQPCFFRIHMKADGLHWETHEWRLGTKNVNAAMLVCPNIKERLGSWHAADDIENHESPYGHGCPKGGEWGRAGGYFVDATVGFYPQGPKWSEEYISYWYE